MNEAVIYVCNVELWSFFERLIANQYSLVAVIFCGGCYGDEDELWVSFWLCGRMIDRLTWFWTYLCADYLPPRLADMIGGDVLYKSEASLCPRYLLTGAHISHTCLPSDVWLDWDVYGMIYRYLFSLVILVPEVLLRW